MPDGHRVIIFLKKCVEHLDTICVHPKLGHKIHKKPTCSTDSLQNYHCVSTHTSSHTSTDMKYESVEWKMNKR